MIFEFALMFELDLVLVLALEMSLLLLLVLKSALESALVLCFWGWC